MTVDGDTARVAKFGLNYQSLAGEDSSLEGLLLCFSYIWGASPPAWLANMFSTSNVRERERVRVSGEGRERVRGRTSEGGSESE